mgnify:CR=1 FL=1
MLAAYLEQAGLHEAALRSRGLGQVEPPIEQQVIEAAQQPLCTPLWLLLASFWLPWWGTLGLGLYVRSQQSTAPRR